jgi:hypothetical protein
MRWKFKNLLFFVVVICCQNLSAIELTLTQKKNLNSKIQLIQKIAANHIIINEVLLRNQKPLSKYENMSEEEWFRLQYIDQKVRFFTTTNSARILREKKDNSMTEMFINNASGTKVGFLSKTSSWNHKNKMKHTEAMKNKIWIGEIEKDLSSGTQQIQVSVPVLNNLIPIGSLVVGLAVHKLN